MVNKRRSYQIVIPDFRITIFSMCKHVLLKCECILVILQTFGICISGGIITREDLVRYEAVKTEPLVIKLKDESTVYSPPLPSSGVVLEFILNILDGM